MLLIKGLNFTQNSKNAYNMHMKSSLHVLKAWLPITLKNMYEVVI